MTVALSNHLFKDDEEALIQSIQNRVLFRESANSFILSPSDRVLKPGQMDHLVNLVSKSDLTIEGVA